MMYDAPPCLTGGKIWIWKLLQMSNDSLKLREIVARSWNISHLLQIQFSLEILAWDWKRVSTAAPDLHNMQYQAGSDRHSQSWQDMRIEENYFSWV